MGGIFSLNNSDSPSDRCKQQRVTWCYKHSTQLIPGLPNDISLQILARVPRVYYVQLKLVSRSWMEALSTTRIYKLRRELNTTEELLFLHCCLAENLLFYVLDPVSQTLQRLPPLPHNSTQNEPQRGLAILQNWKSLGSRIKNAEISRGRFNGCVPHPLDKFPLRGCSTAVVNGCLYVVGGLSRRMTLKCGNGYHVAVGSISRTMTSRCVWRYDPILNVWNEVRPMLTHRAYSKTGVVNNKLYVVGGVRTDRGTMTALESAEVFDPETDEWSEIPSIPCSNNQSMFFKCLSIEPIATELTPYKGKLYVPKYSKDWPNIVYAAGKIYDPESNTWVEMPIGMCDGWPDRMGRNRLSIVVDDDIYALDLLDRGIFYRAKIKVYDKKDDSWKVFSGEVPMPHSPNNVESPYLLAGFGGKLHVIIKDGNSDIAVLEACKPLSSTSSSTGSSVAFSSSEVSWKVIASMRAGPAELISCQILKI